jgi:hypothetical protein
MKPSGKIQEKIENEHRTARAMNLKTFLRRLLCLHEWRVIDDGLYDGHPSGKPIRLVTLACPRCGKTSVHRIR